MSTEKVTRVVIPLNGQIADYSALRQELREDDYWVCADAGAAIACELDCLPQVLLGDFDSIDDEQLEMLRMGGTHIEEFPIDKDKSDFELAIEYTLRLKPEEVLILGPFGKRLDHTLTNIAVAAAQIPSGIKVSLFDGATRAFPLKGPANLILERSGGGTFSLIPLSDNIKDLSAAGVKWPLDKQDLQPGSSLTLSNLIVAARADISLKQGILLVVQIKD